MKETETKVGLVIYPNTEPEIIAPPMWNVFRLPAAKEQVRYKGKTYKVEDVIFDIDENIIKVMLWKSNSPY